MAQLTGRAEGCEGNPDPGAASWLAGIGFVSRSGASRRCRPIRLCGDSALSARRTPPRCPASSNWVRFAHLALVPPGPADMARNWVRFAHVALRGAADLSHWVRLAYSPARPTPPWPRPMRRRRKLALFVRRSFHRLPTTDHRLPATCHCERSAAIMTPRGSASGQGISLPRGRVARIVPEFCEQTTPKNGANPCSQRNKEFFARGVSYLLDCCINVVLPGHM